MVVVANIRPSSPDAEGLVATIKKSISSCSLGSSGSNERIPTDNRLSRAGIPGGLPKRMSLVLRPTLTSAQLRNGATPFSTMHAGLERGRRCEKKFYRYTSRAT